jgi:hypothetical protein
MRAGKSPANFLCAHHVTNKTTSFGILEWNLPSLYSFSTAQKHVMTQNNLAMEWKHPSSIS